MVEEIAEIAARHCGALARLQVFAEIARVGYEQCLIATKIEPEKPVNKELEKYILSQGEEFYDLYQNIAVRIWGTIEAFVSDVCLVLVQRVDWKSPPAKWPNMKVDVAGVLSASADERAEYLLLKLDDHVAGPLKHGVGRFESILDILGMGGPVPDEVKTVLHHLSALRHCVVHNDGRIDRRLIERLPAMKGQAGRRLGITTVEARKFLYAALWYIMEIDRRVCASKGADTSTGTKDQQRYFESLVNDQTPQDCVPFAKASFVFAKAVPLGSKLVVLGPPEKPSGEQKEVRPPSG